MYSTKLKNAVKTLKNTVVNSSQLKFFSDVSQKPESHSVEIIGSQYITKLPIPDALMKDRQIRFMDLVIGPQGQTHRKIARDLECTFYIRAQGGIKAVRNCPKKVYFHISAYAPEKLKIAVEYFTQLMQHPQHREALQIETEKAFGELSFTAENSIALSLPVDKIWVLNGKGRNVLNDAMKHSGAFILAKGENDGSHKKTEVLIKGTDEQREEAKEIFMDYWSERINRPDGKVECEEEMTIPQYVAAHIIGLGGETHKHIEKSSGCSVYISHETAQKVVKLRGTAEEISAAKKEVQRVIDRAVAIKNGQTANRRGKLRPFS